MATSNDSNTGSFNICSPAASFDLSDPSDRNPFYNSQPSFMLKRLFTFVFARKMHSNAEELVPFYQRIWCNLKRHI
ncbi:hypothetical protein T05_8850 [Trichinella murrelli]|uniref:Uncharacterized protein n=1 Tax=Trichinella murrelli TaxID=144512 RepID=A0A0V0TMS6_9BILA|nr:hypothetical protein T05_8850 [Trichinella murrelli]